MKPEQKAKIKIGKNPKIAPNAIIGYRSLRKKSRAAVRIGENPTLLDGAVIYEDVTLGNDATVGHNVIIREENKIGDNFKIWSNSVVDYGCKIGNNVKIHCNAYIAQFTQIEDNVFIGPGVVTVNNIHPGCKFSKQCLKGPRIQAGAQVGAGVVINPYVTIGRNCLIGSGSVVTEDIPANSLAFGNPAVVREKIDNLKCKTDITDRPYKKSRTVKRKK